MRFIRSLLLLATTLLVGVLVVEVFLRILGVSYPLFTQADPLTGFSLLPGAAGWQTDEGKAFVSINSQGMRDREHALEKPAGVFRIAVLGDSFAEARQVDLEETFWSVAGKDVTTCPGLNGRSVEMLNFGVSGFGTTQELLQLREKVWQFRPDIVVLAFTSGNDVRNNSSALEGNADKPYFRMKDGVPELDFSFVSHSLFVRQTTWLAHFKLWILGHSRVLQLVHRVSGLIARRSAPPATSQPESAGAEVGLDDAIYREPQTPEWAEAWELTEAAITAIKKDVESHGARFVLVTLSNGIQVHPDEQIRRSFVEKLGIRDLFYPEWRLGALGVRHGFTVITLAPALAKIAADQKMFLHGFSNTIMGEGHWNRDGHAQAGHILSQMLCTGGYF